MSLYNYLKDVVSDTAISNLAVLTNDKAESLREGMNLAIGSFLVSVQKFTEEKSGLELLNILSAGGHSGDIINSFDVLTASIEKTSLLETIGNNITRHFLGDSVENIASEIAGQAGLSKKTAFTLLSFSAPLTLGVLGKTVKENRLSDDDLEVLLRKEASELKTILEPKIGEALGVKEPEKTSVLKENKIEWIHILPWIILAIIGSGIYYFAYKNKEEPEQAIVIPEQDLLLEESFHVKDSTPSNLSAAPKQTVEVKEEKKVISEEKKSAPKKEKRVSKKIINTPRGLKAVSDDAFKEGSAEVSKDANLNGILKELSRETNKSITLTPLSGAGRLGEDRVFAVRDWLFENGVPISRINISKPKTGFNEAGFGFVIN